MNTTETGFVYADVVKQLSTGKHTITFYKVDGSMRTMCVTRDAGLIPEKHQPKAVGKAVSETTVAVYDLDEGHWKSFLVSNLITIE